MTAFEPDRLMRPVEILLVEDNEGDVYLTKKTFRDAKIANHIHVAADGEEALAILKQEPPFEDHVVPDLILLDINLPKMSGREVLDEIKHDEKLKRIPVIVLTSSGSTQDINDMYGLHANSYVTKPIEVDEFGKVVKSIEQFWMGIVKLPPQS